MPGVRFVHHTANAAPQRRAMRGQSHQPPQRLPVPQQQRCETPREAALRRATRAEELADELRRN
jgi:hypothetical protein